MMAQNLFCIVCYGTIGTRYMDSFLFFLSYLAAAPVLPFFE